MNKDQTKRKQEIAMLQCVVDKNAAAIKHQRLTLERMEEKQIKRLGELQCQKLLLDISERADRCSNEPSSATAAAGRELQPRREPPFAEARG